MLNYTSSTGPKTLPPTWPPSSRARTLWPRRAFPSSSHTGGSPRLTASAPEGLDEEARLLLDALFDAALAHAEVPQRRN